MEKLMILVFVGVAFIFILILKSLKTIDNGEIGIVESIVGLFLTRS